MNRDLNGEGLDFAAAEAVRLAWGETQNKVVVDGGSDLLQLSALRGALLGLKDEFFTGRDQISIAGDKRELLDKRMLLLEHEIDGLLKRRINYGVSEGDMGRVLDYTGILNEKENQIIELEKKIQNLEERLRKASKREVALEDEIARLQGVVRSFNGKTSVSSADLDRLLIGAKDYYALDEKYGNLKAQLSALGGLIHQQFDSLRGKGIRFEHENELNRLLRAEDVTVREFKGIVELVDWNEKVVEVPVQDARTKHLIHLFATQMKKYVDKYPKLRDECDVRLTEFFQQEVIDLLEADDFERVVSIVKYVPEFHRVENVYAYSSEKSRKVEFHLRVLVKALLEELEKLKRKTGAVLEIDEGVVGMINAEIMGVVDVDDILKVFRVVPKIVEVEKVVEKIVERVVEVPQVVAIEKIVEKPVEVTKVAEVEKVIHVPVEVIKYVDNVIEKVVEVPQYTGKIVEVPRVVEKVVERIVEIPKVVEVEVVVEKIVEVEKPVIMEKIVNHTVPEIREIEIFKEKVVPVERVVREVVEVEVLREKVVERVVEVPKVVEVIVEKPVEVVQYRNAKEVVNQAIEVPNVIECIVEKVVPIEKIVERVVEVPKIVEKVVQVQVEVPTIKEVKIVEEKIVYKDRIKEVEKVINKPVVVNNWLVNKKGH